MTDPNNASACSGGCGRRLMPAGVTYTCGDCLRRPEPAPATVGEVDLDRYLGISARAGSGVHGIRAVVAAVRATVDEHGEQLHIQRVGGTKLVPVATARLAGSVAALQALDAEWSADSTAPAPDRVTEADLRQLRGYFRHTAASEESSSTMLAARAVLRLVDAYMAAAAHTETTPPVVHLGAAGKHGWVPVCCENLDADPDLAKTSRDIHEVTCLVCMRIALECDRALIKARSDLVARLQEELVHYRDLAHAGQGVDLSGLKAAVTDHDKQWSYSGEVRVIREARRLVGAVRPDVSADYALAKVNSEMLANRFAQDAAALTGGPQEPPKREPLDRLPCVCDQNRFCLSPNCKRLEGQK